MWWALPISHNQNKFFILIANSCLAGTLCLVLILLLWGNKEDKSPNMNCLSSPLHQATCYEDTCWSGSAGSHRPASPLHPPRSLSLSKPVVAAEPGSSQRKGRRCLGRIGDHIIIIRFQQRQDEPREACSQPACPVEVFQVVKGLTLPSRCPLQLLQADGTLKPRGTHASAVGRIHQFDIALSRTSPIAYGRCQELTSTVTQATEQARTRTLGFGLLSFLASST